MARKNLEVTIVGGSTARVPETPKFEVPAPPTPPKPEAVPDAVVEQETKPSRRKK